MESKKIIIDTSVWVALLIKSDSNHPKTLKYKNLVIQEQVMPDLIFYETLTVLRNKSKDDYPLKTFIGFTTENIDITIRLFYEDNRDVLRLFINEHKDGLSYVDTLLLFLSREYHILTFDEKLRKRIKESGGKLVN
jgi:predicted nucleic acid-binding protein